MLPRGHVPLVAGIGEYRPFKLPADTSHQRVVFSHGCRGALHFSRTPIVFNRLINADLRARFRSRQFTRLGAEFFAGNAVGMSEYFTVRQSATRVPSRKPL